MIVLRGGDVVVLVKSLGAVPVLLGLIVLGLRRGHGGVGLLHFLRPRAVFQLQQLRLRRAQVGIFQLQIGLHGGRAATSERFRDSARLAWAVASAACAVSRWRSNCSRSSRAMTMPFCTVSPSFTVRSMRRPEVLKAISTWVSSMLPETRMRSVGSGMQAAIGQHAGGPQDRDQHDCQNNFFIMAILLFYWIIWRTLPMALPQVDAGDVIAEQRRDAVVAGPFQAGLGVGNFQVAGEAGGVAAARLGKLAVGESQAFLGDFELFFGGMQAVERRADFELDLLVQIVGADALLAELGGHFGAPGVAAAAVENGHAQGDSRSPGWAAARRCCRWFRWCRSRHKRPGWAGART